MKILIFLLFILHFTLSFINPSKLRYAYRKANICFRNKINIVKKSSTFGFIAKNSEYEKRKFAINTKKQIRNIKKISNFNYILNNNDYSKRKVLLKTKRQIKNLKNDVLNEQNNNFKIVFLEQFCIEVDNLIILNDMDKELLKLTISSFINKNIYFNIPIKNIIISFTFHSLFSHSIYKIKIYLINSPIYNSPEFQYIIHIFKK